MTKDFDRTPTVGGILNVVEDTTPQLGAQLDINGFGLGDGTLELLTFTETASAINHVNIINAATGNAPRVSAVGDNTDIDLALVAKGTGDFTILDPADVTSIWKFDPSTIATGTTRTLTMPDADVALQAPSAVTITGGTIDNVVIGGTTPVAGTFTFGNFGTGTAGAPSITFSIDSNTGFFNPGDGRIGVDLNGAEKFEFLLNTFKGTTSGAGALLNLTTSATVPTFVPNISDLNSGIGQNALDQLSLIAGGIEGLRITEAANAITHDFTGVSGSLVGLKTASTELTALTGASVTATNLIPAGSFIVGVTIRVTTTITGATSFTIGDGTDPDRWGTGIALTAGTTTDITDFTAAGFGQFATANDVVLTATGPNFTAGAVRIVVNFFDLTAATS